MGNQISPLGWFLIILLVLLIASLYVSLFTKIKGKGKDNKTGWITSLQSAGKAIKNPFWYENSKMQELAENVEKIQKRAGTDADPNIGSREVGDPK